VGIHHGHGAQSFERLHVTLADLVVRASERAGVRKLVQLSVLCARPDARSAYHDSKHRADERIRQAAVPWLVLKPAVIHGADDNFTARILVFLRLGVVPMPGGGVGRHAPVHVDDVAAAVVRGFAADGPSGVSLGLCGPRTLAYAALVRELAAAQGLRPLLVPVPVALVRLAAAATAWLADPPISLGQLLMVTEGMAEDTGAAWAQLGVAPRPFAAG
jgi:NADH dehydrogenase